MEYSINQLAMITGYTTRSLRSFIKDGSLNGEKVDGVWMFTEDLRLPFVLCLFCLGLFD
jgi:hypothetical protein